MYGIRISKKLKSPQILFKQFLTISSEFYYFLILLAVFNFYIFCTLQYEDENLSKLTQESINRMSEASFTDTISVLSPHFEIFERNCKQNPLNYAEDVWEVINDILWENFTFRLPYLFVLYRFVLYLESKWQCKRMTSQSNRVRIVQKQYKSKNKNKNTSPKPSIKWRLIMCAINTLLFFIYNMMDTIYIRWSYNYSAYDTDKGLMDYSNLSLLQRFMNIIFIYVRVHPTNSWLVRLSHGIGYPFTLYAITRPTISAFLRWNLITIVLLIFAIGEMGHSLDYTDMQLRCVRQSFIISTRHSSIHGEALRATIAPYLNMVCLTIDCAKFVL